MEFITLYIVLMCLTVALKFVLIRWWIAVPWKEACNLVVDLSEFHYPGQGLYNTHFIIVSLIFTLLTCSLVYSIGCYFLQAWLISSWYGVSHIVLFLDSGRQPHCSLVFQFFYAGWIRLVWPKHYGWSVLLRDAPLDLTAVECLKHL